MPRPLRVVLHYVSPSLFLAAALLFLLCPALEVSCDDQVQTYTGRDLLSTDGPLGDDGEDIGSWDPSTSIGEWKEQQAHDRRALRHELLVGLLLGVAGTLGVALMRPRWQGLATSLLGGSSWWALSDVRDRLTTALQASSDMVTARTRFGWDVPIGLLLAAAVWGAARLAVSFRSGGNAPLVEPRPKTDAESRPRRRVPWKPILAGSVAIAGLALAWNPTVTWLRTFRTLDATVEVPGGCLAVDSSWESEDSAGTAKRRLCSDTLRMDRYEATWKTFLKAFPDRTPSPACKGEDDAGNPICGTFSPDLPVHDVGLVEADSFCRSRGMRLPTLAEWEYAAREARRRDESPVPDSIWSGGATIPAFEGTTFTTPVGSHPANALGLSDMFGNVREWTATCRDAEGNPVPLRQAVSARFEDRIDCDLAGGSWLSTPTSNSWYDEEGLSNIDIGVRCVR